jgi:hypothetical protein
MSRAVRLVGTVAVAVVVALAAGSAGGAGGSAPSSEATTPVSADVGAPVPPHDSQPPTVTLFADSLGFEATDVVASALAGHAHFESSSFPGVAMCDLVGALRRAPEQAPDVAILQFSGNSLTDCMRGPDGQLLDDSAVVDKYAADVEQVIRILRSRGSRVYLAGSPRTALSPRTQDINTIYAWTAMNWKARGEPVRYFDAASPVLNTDGSFAARLPCLPGETAAEGCHPDGTIDVRSPDGTHFCPVETAGKVACPVWSAGAYRFGMAIAAEARQALP